MESFYSELDILISCTPQLNLPTAKQKKDILDVSRASDRC